MSADTGRHQTVTPGSSSEDGAGRVPARSRIGFEFWQRGLAAILITAGLVLAGARLVQAQLATLEPVAVGLADPISLTHAGDGSRRLFVTLQDGRVVILGDTGILPTPWGQNTHAASR